MSVALTTHRCPAILFVLLFTSGLAAHEEQIRPQDASAATGEAAPEQQVKDSNEAAVNSSKAPGLARRPGPRSFLRTFAADQKALWTSPSRISRRDLKWILPVIAGTAIAIGTDDRLSEQLPTPDDPARIAGKRVSYFGALYTLAGLSGGTYLIGRVAGKERLRDTGWMSLEALAHTQVVVQGIKLATQRERPPEITERRGFWKGGGSFPSGHAASAWAFATVISRQYGDKKIVPIAVYSLATVVSAARLSARRHYASDILVGGVVGHLIGRYIHKSHGPADQPHRAVAVTPRVGLRYSRLARHYGLNLSWQF